MVNFLFILIFYRTYINSVTFIQYIHPSPLAGVPHHPLISVQLSEIKPPWSAEPRIELGPALQKAQAPPAELPLTLTELRRTLD
jgi:hypothetical protein